MCVVTDRMDGRETSYRPTSCPCDCPHGWIRSDCDQPESNHRQELQEPPLADDFELPEARLAATAVTGQPVTGLPLPNGMTTRSEDLP